MKVRYLYRKSRKGIKNLDILYLQAKALLGRSRCHSGCASLTDVSSAMRLSERREVDEMITEEST